MVHYTQQLRRKYKQQNLSLGTVVWWVEALHSELEAFHFKPTRCLTRDGNPTSLQGSQLALGGESMKHSDCVSEAAPS